MTQLSFMLVFLIFIFTREIDSFAFTSKMLKARSRQLCAAQKFTSFDDMLSKIETPVLVDFFALWYV